MASLAEEISKLTNPCSQFVDPEDDIATETVANVIDKSEVNAHEIVSPSELRRRAAPLLSELSLRYAGRKVSRKELDENADQKTEESGNETEDNNSTISSEFESDDGVEKFKEEFMQISDKEESSEEVIGDTIISGRKGEETDSDTTDEDEESGDDLIQKFSTFDVNEELEKGKAVKSQLALWDNLLDCRIKLQKILLLANRLPQASSWDLFIEQASDDYKSSVKEGKDAAKNLLDLLINLQTHLMKQNPELQHIICGEKSKKQNYSDSDEEIPSESSDDDYISDGKKCEENSPTVRNPKRKLKIEDYPDLLNKRQKSFTPYQNAVIQKWNEKTRLASGKISHKSFGAFDQSALKQIEQILHDKSRLIKRTQLKRSVYRVLGKTEQQVQGGDENEMLGQEVLPQREDHLKDYDSEVFDDSDFYHQLLRELIERKTVDVNDPIALSRQWLEIQKLRSKMKRKVDTKASKGRKLRYDVHPKLVNFMAPIDNSSMTDGAKNELYRSLFGKSNCMPV